MDYNHIKLDSDRHFNEKHCSDMNMTVAGADRVALPRNKQVTHVSVAPLAPFVGEDHHFHPLSQMLLLKKTHP